MKNTFRFGFVLSIVSGIILFSAMAMSLQASTNVSGYITTNTIWNTAGSPYIVKGNLFINAGITLTINPGVIVKIDTMKGGVDTSTSIAVNGRLVVSGTQANPVTFTSILVSPSKPEWVQIKFNAGSFGQITNCIIEYGGQTETSVLYSLSDSLTILNSVITNNGGGIANLGEMTITNSTITNNTEGIDNGGRMTITNCAITNNVGNSFGNGIANSGMITITNSTITNNDIGYTDYSGVSDTVTITNSTIAYNYSGGIIFVNKGNADIESCTIRKNGTYAGITLNGTGKIKNNLIVYQDQGGIRTGTDSIQIEGNIIAGNGTTGIICAGNSSIDLNSIVDNDEAISNTGNPILLHNTITRNSSGILNCGNLVIDSSNIYDNSPYWIDNRFPYDINASNNWWGTTDAGTIDSCIYDYYDNNGLGKVIYSPFSTSADTLSPVPPPSGFKAKSGKGNTITLQWNGLNLADLAGYKVYYDKKSGYPYSGTGASEGNSPIDVGNTTGFTLTGLDPLGYYVVVTGYDRDGNQSWYSEEQTVNLTGVEESSELRVKSAELKTSNNPFRQTTVINYQLPVKSKVSLEIYDLSGRTVKTLVNEQKPAGSYNVNLNAKELSSGVYFVRFTADNYKDTKKLILMK